MEKWFGREIIRWYGHNQRQLPWREQNDPYLIWLSEIILQQTQVQQGLGYYLKFSHRYPTIQHLAKASEDEVLKMWQGLGYYSRARNLHYTAKIISSQYNGIFPGTFSGIRNLKGIGDYTAAAIASFAFGLPHAVVDGNVYRLLSRVFGIGTPIDSTVGKKQFTVMANALLDKNAPALFNQAIMEFGSQYCRPANPDCERCIFKARCAAFKSGKVSELPVKSKRTRVTQRFLNYVVLADKSGKVIIRKRDQKDIWRGLYEFNLIESKKKLSPKQFFLTDGFRNLCKPGDVIRHVSGDYRHVLTHQRLHARFCVVQTKKIFAGRVMKTSVSKLNTFAFPRLIEKFLNDCDLKELL
jgi:A/G-specific adenine glycosylase